MKSYLFGKDYKSSLVQHGLGSIIIKTTYVLFSFLLGVVLVRTLGAENYGIYGYVISIIAVLNVPAEFGLPNLIIRETAKNIALQRYGHINGLWKWSYKIIVFITLIILIGSLIYIHFFDASLEEWHQSTLILGILLLPLISLGHLRRSQLLGLNKIIESQLPEQILQPLLIIIFVLVSTIFANEFNAPWAMVLHILASLIAFIVGSVVLVRNIPTQIRTAMPEWEKKAWLKSTIPFAGNSGINILNKHASILILGLFVNAPEIGFYKIAINFAIAAAIGNQIVSLVVNPQYASLYAKGQNIRLKKLVRTGAIVSFSMSLIILSFILVFGKKFLGVVYGSDFIQAYIPLLILLVGQSVNAMTGPAANLLNMTGKEIFTTKGIILSTVINIILNLILIPKYGLVGASLGTSLSLIIFNIYLWFTIRSNLGINCFICKLPFLGE